MNGVCAVKYFIIGYIPSSATCTYKLSFPLFRIGTIFSYVFHVLLVQTKAASSSIQLSAKPLNFLVLYGTSHFVILRPHSVEWQDE